MSDKTILEQWRAIAYDQQADRNKLQQFWAKYFNIEKNIYAQLLENPDEVVTGFTIFHNGTRSLPRRNVKSFILSRRNPVLL